MTRDAILLWIGLVSVDSSGMPAFNPSNDLLQESLAVFIKAKEIDVGNIPIGFFFFFFEVA